MESGVHWVESEAITRLEGMKQSKSRNLLMKCETESDNGVSLVHALWQHTQIHERFIEVLAQRVRSPIFRGSNPTAS